MDEAQRFLRYVVPGLLFLTLTAVMSLILLPDWASRQLLQFSGRTDLGEVIVGLAASGVLGFLFASLHHQLHWVSGNQASDHRKWLHDAVERGLLELRDPRTGFSTGAPHDAESAWSVLSAVWYQHIEVSPRVKSATARTISLADLVHTLGTARLAVAAALLAAGWLAVRVSVPDLAPSVAWTLIVWLAASGVMHTVPHQFKRPTGFGFSVVVVDGFVFLLGIVFIVAIGAPPATGLSGASTIACFSFSVVLFGMFQASYVRTGRMTRRVIESALSDALHAEVMEGKKPVVTYISPRNPTLPRVRGNRT